MKYHWALLGLIAAVTGCKLPMARNLPPAQQIMHPGPGVDGPGPGVMMLGDDGGGGGGAGGYGGMTAESKTQIEFAGPDGMMIAWDVTEPGMFDSEPLVCPAKQPFGQGAMYRLKLTNIPGREGVELYPSLEVGYAMPRTAAYLAHATVPVQFTEEDLDQVINGGNFVTKVIYLPDAENQDLAMSGVETLVSTRLDQGLDPIIEADRLGSIMAIVRVGNKDLEIPGDDEVSGGDIGGGMGEDCADCEGGGGGIPPQFVSGVTAPQYGMTMSGTPIGLPGPPHIPLGGPAGLRRHTIRNHTFTRIPNPVRTVRLHVKQSPGMSYPRPASRAFIHERARAPWVNFDQPWGNSLNRVNGPETEDCQ